MNLLNTKNTQNNTFEFIILLKFIAIILITNSHLGSLYPSKISFLSTGGALGNLLFFLSSGYTIYYSNKDKFLHFYKRRVMRIYPAIWIAMVLLNLLDYKEISFQSLVYPTDYWFIGAILFFYIIYFLIAKYLSNYFIHLISFLSILLFVIYFLYLDQTYVLNTSSKFVWIYYFIAFLLGGYLAKINSQNSEPLWIDLLLFIISFSFYNFIAFRYGQDKLYILAIPFILLASFFLFRLCLSKKILKIFQMPILKNSIVFISNLTLEIYIVQFSCIHFCLRFSKSYSVLIAIALIIISAFILHKLVKVFLWVFSGQSNMNAVKMKLDNSVNN